MDPLNNLRAVMEQQEEEVSVQSHPNIIHSKLLTPQWFVGEYSDLPGLVDNVIRVFGASHLFDMGEDPRHIYRSMLPFLPPSSPILVHYKKLSDIRILRVCSQNNNFQRGDPPISSITCSALSDDGHRVALGFDDGVVEVVDTELATTISPSARLPNPPVWLLFVDGGHKLVIETSKGDIYIWENFTLHLQQFSSRIDGSTRVVTSLSRDGSMIVRAAQQSTKVWYENMYIIHIATDNPTIHSLSTPPHIIPYRGKGRRFPLQRSVGFSPDGRYVAAFDTQQAFVWSSISFELIAHYSIEDPRTWFLNVHRPSTIPTLALPNDVIISPFPEHSGSIHSISCVLFNLAPRRSADLDCPMMQALSLAAAAVPVLDSRRRIWFRGREIMIIPDTYWNSIKPASGLPPFWESPSYYSFLTSKDGTRFLLFDKERCPVLVDISGVISDRTT